MESRASKLQGSRVIGRRYAVSAKLQVAFQDFHRRMIKQRLQQTLVVCRLCIAHDDLLAALLGRPTGQQPLEVKRVDCERLLLPFGKFGRVGQLLASLQLISVDGYFSRNSILESFELKADVALVGIVKLNGAHLEKVLLE
jgi:hypothetical protein